MGNMRPRHEVKFSSYLKETLMPETPSTHTKPSKRRRRPQQRQRVTLASIINGWWERLFSAVFGGTWDQQPHMYESGCGGRDYLLNTLGSVAWGALFPLLTVVATQLSGAERAGHFTMAFTTATLLLYVGNYGVKTFQISDLEETESFSSYRAHRLLTCLFMLLIGFAYCAIRGYDSEMWLISAGAYGFRAIDALDDTYEARSSAARQALSSRCVSGRAIRLRRNVLFPAASHHKEPRSRKHRHGHRRLGLVHLAHGSAHKA